MRSEIALEELEILTEKMNKSIGDPDMIWPLEGSKEVEAYRLHREARVAVLRACIDEGAPFPRHIHGEDEVLICYDGKLLWKVHEKGPEEEDFSLSPETADGVLIPGEALRIPANTPHSVMAIDGDCWFIAVTVPASKGF